MAKTTEVRVPDIGDFSDVPVIEIMVSPGDRVEVESPLVTLESDKATMDVPSPEAGVVRELKVSVGDSVSEGTVLLVIDAGDAAGDDDDDAGDTQEAPAREPAPARGNGEDRSPAPAAGGGVAEVRVPDIGDFSGVPVIEIMVSPGDEVSVESPLVTLESDKATMDVPSPVRGRVESVSVSVGDHVSEGDLLLTVASADDEAAPASAPAPGEPRDAAPAASASSAPEEPPPPADAPEMPPMSPEEPRASAADPRAPRGRPSPTAALAGDGADRPRAHASPAVRRYARELGVDLAEVKGTGRKGRVLKDDVSGFVKEALSRPRDAPPGAGIEPIPAVDFSKYGETETRPLSRIKRISGTHLRRAWLNIPHVTNHDEADVTELEAFRQSIKDEAAKRGARVTMLAFLTKAVAATLESFPTFNASLSPDGESLILKKYFHVGIAVDTPGGLVVPVMRDVDRKGIYEIAEEMGDLSARARDGKLKPDEMQGGCFSISSLGGIGGTAFTPIINAPEVAILGVSRSKTAPVWDGEQFVPRLMLPLDLSWDHRVVDGAEAARFLANLCRLLADVRRLIL